MLPSEIPNSPQTCQWEGFLVFGNFSFTTPSPGWVSIPDSCLSFCLLYFVLTPFIENGLPFWVLGVLCQRSEVVLWKLLSIQMIFWWICGGESGFPVLFLHQLRLLESRDIMYERVIWKLRHATTYVFGETQEEDGWEHNPGNTFI